MARRRQQEEPPDRDQLFRMLFDPKRLAHVSAVESLRQHLTGRRCLLLDDAAQARAQGTWDACLARLDQFPVSDALRGHLGPAIAAYEARRGLIQLLGESHGDRSAAPADITAALETIVTRTATLWNAHRFEPALQLMAERMPPGRDPVSGRYREPSFMDCLPNDGWRTAFRELAAEYGWMHPGLLLAGETLRAIYGDSRPVAARVQTSVLFAVRHAERSFGLVAKLTVERLTGGCGMLLPDPWSAAYLSMDQDFSQGLQHAWYAIQQAHPQPCDFDWRWSLDLYHATARLPAPPVTVTLRGPSAEGAFACALRAVDVRRLPRGVAVEALDVHVALTAQLAQPGSASLQLAPVTDVDVKTLAFPFQERRIREVMIAADHDEADLPPQNDRAASSGSLVSLGEGPRFEQVATVEAAYARLARGPRITQAVKQSLFRTATALREKLCGPEVDDWRTEGRRYVPSPLAELLPGVKVAGRSTEEQPQQRLLSREELRTFSQGHWRSPRGIPAVDGLDRAPRIRLYADSGLGKTIQLLICEQKIAGKAGSVIPIRLGKTDRDSGNLSGIDWTSTPQTIVQNIFKRYIEVRVPDADRAAAETWFTECVQNGQVVFLCDALDQSRSTLEGMGHFLNSALVQGCPVILAGRPETRFSREAAYEGINEADWTTMKVLPFDRTAQARFLGRRLAEQLIPENEELDSWEDDADEIRRHLWKDLLGVPLLLRFLKDLANAEGPGTEQPLQHLRNRYAIYKAAVDQLIRKGMQTVPGSPQVLQKQVERRLPQIAFAAVRRHDFSAVVEKDAFEEVFTKIEGLFDELVQVDLVTEHGVFDSVGRQGLEFRHRSMLEYFAGRRLTELFRDPSTQAEAVQVLYSVQSVLEVDGTFRRDLLNKDGVTCRNLPQDWDWTLRFALGHAETLGVQDVLAWQLIIFGNPWVVDRAIEQDGLTFDADLKMVCRWLVHRLFSKTEAWKLPVDPPLVDAWRHWLRQPCWVGPQAKVAESMAARLSGLLSRGSRDALWMSPLMELLTATVQTPAEACGAEDEIHAVCAAALAAYQSERSQALTATERCALDDMETRLIPIPAGEFDPRPFHGVSTLQNALVRGPLPIPKGMSMGDFPVTNSELEAWCPTNRRWRSAFSQADDQPVVNVTGWAATAYAVWLTGSRTDGFFGLPTEWEWEWVCRGADPSRSEFAATFWWGDTERTDLLWRYNVAQGDQPRFRHRSESVAIMESLATTEGVAHPSRQWALSAGLSLSNGLLDLHGNVWEWCNSWSQMVGVLRGGVSHRSEDPTLCGSKYRMEFDPSARLAHTGFRLVWRGGISPSEWSNSWSQLFALWYPLRGV